MHIHHNYIHDTGRRDVSIDLGLCNDYQKRCNGYAHLLENIEITNNRIENSGWDAIQVSLAHKNVLIHHNEINGYGFHAAQENEINQSFGIALGGGTRARA